MGWIVEGPWSTEHGRVWQADMSDLSHRQWGKFPNGDPLVLELLSPFYNGDDLSHWEGVLHDGTVVFIWND